MMSREGEVRSRRWWRGVEGEREREVVWRVMGSEERDLAIERPRRPDAPVNRTTGGEGDDM